MPPIEKSGSFGPRPKRRTLDAGDLFSKLFDLYGRLERDTDGYELVLTDGLLSWQTNFEIYHPVLSTTLTLRFDASVPEFIISETGSGTDFNYSLFSNVEGIDGTLIGRMRAEVTELGLHPLGNGATPGFLRSIPTRLSKDGQYVGERDPGKPTSIPIIGRLPAIVLRKRTSGLAQAISAVVEAIKNGGEIPIPLVNIVGVDEAPRHATDEAEPYSRIVDANADETVLFTKPANAEQLMIARALSREDGVLVQGPPGTGKTHTIANLLGHLLAQGKTVLVTSQTSRALKVLKDKVTPKLQALCVSVIDTVEDDAVLKASIDGIVERIGFSDESGLQRDIDQFERRRLNLITTLRGLKSQLKTARLDEHIDIVVGGQPIHPSEAAKVVAAGIGTNDWIPSPVSLGSTLPLPIGELTRLYATNEEVSQNEELTIKSDLPDLKDLMPPSEFKELVEEYRSLEKLDLSKGQHLWQEPADEWRPSEALESTYTTVSDLLRIIDRAPAWATKLVEVGLVASDVALWQTLISDIEAFHADTAEAKALLIAYQPETAKRLDSERAQVIYETLAAEVKRTGKVPGFIALIGHADWKIAMEESRVEGDVRPKTAEQFYALAAKAGLERRQRQLIRRWSNQVVSMGGPELAEAEFVDAAMRQLPAMRMALSWADTHWQRGLTSLQLVGLNWAGVLDESLYEFGGLSNIERIRALTASVFQKSLQTNATVGAGLSSRQYLWRYATWSGPGTKPAFRAH